MKRAFHISIAVLRSLENKVHFPFVRTDEGRLFSVGKSGGENVRKRLVVPLLPFLRAPEPFPDFVADPVNVFPNGRDVVQLVRKRDKEHLERSVFEALERVRLAVFPGVVRLVRLRDRADEVGDFAPERIPDFLKGDTGVLQGVVEDAGRDNLHPAFRFDENLCDVQWVRDVRDHRSLAVVSGMRPGREFDGLENHGCGLVNFELLRNGKSMGFANSSTHAAVVQNTTPTAPAYLMKT